MMKIPLTRLYGWVLTLSLAGMPCLFAFASIATFSAKHGGHRGVSYLQDTVPVPPLVQDTVPDQRDTVPASAKTVKGKVTDQDGASLPGATVQVKGTSNGTITDDSGHYSISLPAENESPVLVFSFVGFEGKEITVGNQSQIDVSLASEEEELEEVVVIGYGSARKADLTGAISQVSAEEVNAFPTTSVVQAMAGRAPGVQVVQNNGSPGGGVNIRIRGSNSIQGDNSPLYVIDGFPYSGNPTNLNNSDIASIEVLKDASATAIYGSRGANGVVLITTKGGVQSPTQVEFDSYYSVQRLRKKLDLMNGRQYGQLMNIQAENDGLAPYFSESELSAMGNGTDWQDQVFDKAPIKSSSIRVSGGNESTRFSVGGSIFDQEGIIKGSDYNRYALQSSIHHSLSDKLTIDFSTNLTKLTTARRDSDGGARGNSMIGAALVASPLSTPYGQDGSLTVLSQDFPFVSPDIINPLNYINEEFNTVNANIVLANASVSYSPVPKLTIKVLGGIENRDDRTDVYRTTDFINSDGNASVNTRQYISRLNENTISYTDTLDERHKFDVLAGFTYQDFQTRYLAGSAAGFLSDLFETDNLGAANTPGVPTSGYAKSVLLSYIGRLNYNYADKYLFTATWRADGSSRYSEGNKWGHFPSAALAWRVSQEGFMKDQKAISALKLRTSWGLTGSQAIDPYSTLNRLFPGYTVFGDELYSTFAPQAVLPGDLKWETTEQFDVGMDVGLIGGRIMLGADFYIKNTRDLLSTVRLPSSYGYTTTVANVGEVQNKGLELSMDAIVLNRAFRWNLSGNISFNRNKVISLNDGEPILTNYINVVTVADNFSIMEEGRPLGQFWGYQEDGFTEQGDIRYRDLNGDGEITEADKTAIGDPNPDFYYGINSTMNFKNFQLDIFLQGSKGNDIFNVSSISSTMDYGQGLNMPEAVLLDHWSADNPDAAYPRISRNNDLKVSDRYVEDGSYMRLKNVQLAYDFSFPQSKWIGNLKLYVSGQNLLTFTDYSWWDPEVNSNGGDTSLGIDHYSYPIPKSYTVGLRATF
ncbi:SusC/RagA family TonB-linked outer membrane protein [Echinicola rosea]|uniref:SusC/RagA family TonB-linked outer membrane protein n=2 Tax=Echinicola rosea TaxID=1807691 RepID=A0ABQ1UT18_9BACT|nr:SusC/RagA family TonB-linked outer membrane protein [Echinicola rosea]